MSALADAAVRGRTRIAMPHGRPATWAAAIALALVCLAAALAPLVAPQDPEAVDLSATLAGPSSAHLLGADLQGRDVLSRLIFGARPSLLAPLAIVLASTLAGVALGTLAGWRRGRVDAVLRRLLDLAFAFPGILLALVIVTRTGPGLLGPSLAIALWLTPHVARLVRSATIAEAARPYVDAYRVLGWSGPAIVSRAIVPNLAGLVAARAALNFGTALMALGALSYLGFGIQPPAADWGAMVNEGRDALQQGVLLPSLAPAAALVVVVVAVNVLGEALADRVARREG